MRLPVTPQLSTKDGVSAKNARLTNCLKETTKRGDMAVIRPGLVLSDTFTGVGSGLIPFDGRLLQIWNDTVYDQNDYGTWPLDAPEWDASTTYDWNAAVWYDGDLWFSTAGSNMGHAPGGGYWSRSPDDTDYEAGTTYNVGDSVTMGGVVYYAVIAGSGHTPSESSDYWSVTAPGTSRYRVSSVSFNGTALGSGPISSYRDGAAIGAYSLVPYLECTAPHYTGFWAVGIAPINNVGATWYANAYVKLGCAPQAPGIFSIGSIDAV